MNILQKNIWEFLGKVDAICITTNGFIKRDGSCPMGRGIAKEALNRYPGIDKKLGSYLSQWGNRPFKLIQDQGTWIVSFPTKLSGLELSLSFAQEEKKMGRDYVSSIVSWAQGKYRLGDTVPGYHLKSSTKLIQQSAQVVRLQRN